MKPTVRTMMGLLSLAMVAGGAMGGPGSDIARALAAPGDDEPDPRKPSDTGRGRARRRRRAVRIARGTGFSTDDCYRAIGDGRVESQIRAARAAEREAWWVES